MVVGSVGKSEAGASSAMGVVRAGSFSSAAVRHALPLCVPTPPPPPFYAGATVLVPLTSSLYVPGVLDPSARVLVDVGTSFFVGKSPADAHDLLERKAALLKTNTETLYRVIVEKREQLDTVAEAVAMRQQQAQARG